MDLLYNSITKLGLFPNFSYIFTKPDQKIDLSLKDTYEISEFTEIIKNINFDIEIDKSSIIKESQVSNKEIDRYDELLRSIITIGSIDINFSSRSNSLIISYILFIFIVIKLLMSVETSLLLAPSIYDYNPHYQTDKKRCSN